ncbi:hypothetical protein ANANG_G00026960 [Anguilla anguilla]|uniref:Uncharacterized protein n=1 Tax=Anguilla anguilla TaxID=7936 RepID=A0A9D3MR48_ANGAN|nr:hypothetical protein ANANG_G00026960 [Anguilla anguilla]
MVPSFRSSSAADCWEFAVSFLCLMLWSLAHIPACFVLSALPGPGVDSPPEPSVVEGLEAGLSVSTLFSASAPGLGDGLALARLSAL